MDNLDSRNIFSTQKIRSDLIKTNFIKVKEPLNNKNWFKTGGKAEFYCEPTTVQEFKDALSFSKNNSLDIFILGTGANILIADSGFKGLVIRPKLLNIEQIQVDKSIDINIKNINLDTKSKYYLVKAGSGVIFQNLIDYCLDNSLIGLEEFSGIPGTVGGSVFINIHYFDFLLSDFLVSAEVINKSTGETITVSYNWFKFSYNFSTLHLKNYYLVSATFKLKKVENITTTYFKGKRDEIVRHRSKKYPTLGTCGSFFRNFLDHEVKLLTNNSKKLIYVAYYLDKIGIKGELSCGGATVSYQHANMIVNNGNATTQDIVNLAINMQKLVYNKFKILPQPECQLIGFKEYPLLT